MIRYKKMREKYKPRKVDVLFIGESPPPDELSCTPYFYNEEQDLPRKLYRKIAYALDLKGRKPQGLREFEERGMWLTDIFDEPRKKVKPETVEAHLDRLFQEVKGANPSKIITLLPKRRSNDVFLYFFKNQFPKIKMLHTNPWGENKEQFKRRLAEFLRDC